MTKLERMKEIMKASPNFGKGVGYKMCVVDELHDMKELEKELKAEKEYSVSLRKEIDEYTNSHTLCAKYKQLEKEISILLSCKDCPDNKGGYICEKEYEGKCLSQKTQYIKELQEEIAELKEQCSILADCNTCFSSCKTENIEMKKQLSYAKTIIQDLLDNTDEYARQRAIDFLKEEENDE